MHPIYNTTNCRIIVIDRAPSNILAPTTLTGSRPRAPLVDAAGFLVSDGSPDVEVGVTSNAVGAGGDSAAE